MRIYKSKRTFNLNCTENIICIENFIQHKSERGKTKIRIR